ncbi:MULTISPECIES: DNA-binding protein [Providencia]|uniref:DNA-binding protein n=1 Tax=Providencia TaxID=586 RepID=UPI00159B5A34|nr:MULTISPECIES: DNA-binding protein [Providencia]ELR5256015.1 DNA-binding protein [Providencia rettgeri]ELR5280193.1 DNA-binding protein [Providencia rettgeri]MBQ0208666.1 DNA-binding protein [Providencia rettgeri]MBQ0687516.1 DNA-binding protein [Providencia rettgeri]MDR9613173.1 DNA-binding protein [Providencia rettgeri]
MYYFLAVLLLIFSIILLRIRAVKAANKSQVIPFKTFREYEGIDDYEKAVKHAVYAISKCHTVMDKMKCYFDLRVLSYALYSDYEHEENMVAALEGLLTQKFTFTYSSFIIPYPEPVEETALARFYLTQTRAHCPQNIWDYLLDASVMTNEEIDAINTLESALEVHHTLMGTILYDEKIGCYFDEDYTKPAIYDNDVYTVTEAQLNQWLDEELDLMAFYCESLLKVCIEYIKKENGIIRV